MKGVNEKNGGGLNLPRVLMAAARIYMPWSDEDRRPESECGNNVLIAGLLAFQLSIHLVVVRVANTALSIYRWHAHCFLTVLVL